MKEATQIDPRQEPGFSPECLPRCDGKPLPSEPANSVDHQKLLLASAYYRVNKAYVALCELRTSKESPPSDDERVVLQRMEAALLQKENQEDELAHAGICARPTIKEGIVIDLEFCTPSNRDVQKVAVEHSSSITVEFNFDFPWDDDSDHLDGQQETDPEK